LLQPNVSNGVLILATGIAMLFVAGIRIQHFLAFAGGGFVMALGYALYKPHSFKRISSHLGAIFGDGDFHPQVMQSLYGLGSGGVLGVGLGHSAQRNLFLPEAYGDFIFAVAGEEAGMIGTVGVLLAYSAILVCGLIIAKNAKDKFGKLLAFAIAFSIPLYGFVNAAVAIGVVPVTGLPLPLISHGGTAIIIVCSSIGILLNIGLSSKTDEAKQTSTKKEAKTWQEQPV
jgi:cell division protein FtsW